MRAVVIVAVILFATTLESITAQRVTYQSFLSQGPDARKATFLSLSPADKARIASEHVSSLLKNEPFTPEQRTLFVSMLGQLTPAFYTDKSGAHQGLSLGWQRRLHELFPDAKRYKALTLKFRKATSTPKPYAASLDTQALSIVPVRQNNYCNCADYGDCTGSDYCEQLDCTSTTDGCGMYLDIPCTKQCYSPGNAAKHISKPCTALGQ